jgi:hypothetical protein
MFCDPSRVGAFATTPEKFAAGDPSALFKVLCAMIMFQRRQDVQIARILRGMAPAVAREITSSRRLLKLVDESACEFMKTSASLHAHCDLTKNARGAGACSAHPALPCHLKDHTVVMKRYGHFGKFPTSAALLLREAHVRDLRALRERVLSAHADPGHRAEALEQALSRIWRVGQKIASMFLSAVTNPDLGPAPWREGVDWAHFVVIDSNVDLFLSAIGYAGSGTYDARRRFVVEVARRIDLQRCGHAGQPYNPRLVQQAMYLFMSAANRRALEGDCMRKGVCGQCPLPLRTRCPVRSVKLIASAHTRESTPD